MTLQERGAQLHRERRRRGLSRFTVAVSAGVHPNSVLAAEKGTASAETVRRVEQALGIREERAA